MTDKVYVWRKTREADYVNVETFLRSREIYCVNACSRFITGNFKRGHLWNMRDAKGNISALLLHSRRSLLPVYTGNYHAIPHFLDRFLKEISIHSVQGLREDAEILEQGIKDCGYNITDRNDYDIMTLDQNSLPECFKRGPPDLVIRFPNEADREELLELHSAYEQEEVIPLGGFFSPENCRKTLAKILFSEQMLVACLGNRIVGKINTNAKSFTRSQIGGVYVRPEYRKMGIAQKLSAVFAQELIAQGMGLSLYVKKQNIAARSVYCRLGFVIRGDYRISYY